jgi:hypothetical protein
MRASKMAAFEKELSAAAGRWRTGELAPTMISSAVLAIDYDDERVRQLFGATWRTRLGVLAKSEESVPLSSLNYCRDFC